MQSVNLITGQPRAYTLPDSLGLKCQLLADYLARDGWAILVGNDVRLDKRPSYRECEVIPVSRKNGNGAYTIWAVRPKSSQAMDVTAQENPESQAGQDEPEESFDDFEIDINQTGGLDI